MSDQTNTTVQRREGAALPMNTRRNYDHEPILEQVLKGEFTSQQIEDPFKSFTGASVTSKISEIKPPFNPSALLRMAMENSTLKQCIEAMVTNISGHGHRLEYIGPEGQSQDDAAVAEARNIEQFLKHPNGDYSILELRKRVRWDLETLGNAFIEVARNRKGQITAAWHVPGHLMRLTEVDKEPTSVMVKLPRFDGVEERKVDKYFRRFVQIKGMKRVYFKEYGDPRPIDPSDGAVNPGLGFEDTATEIIHLSLYHAGYAYGMPRWINNVVAIQGSRQAELTNLDFFSENAIPAMIIMVAGGMISQSTLTALETHFTAMRGRQAANRVVVVEAFGDENAKDDKGSIPPPRIDIKPMSADRPKEGMFLEYDKAQTDKVRSSFRLPPIFLGLSEDYTHATANTSYDVAEGQVFGPERVREDDVINRMLLGDYGLQYWEVRSNPPRITDPTEVLDAIDRFNTVGAMTPNTAIGIANEMFDLQIETIEEEWGNLPMSVVEQLVSSGQLSPDEEGVLHFTGDTDQPTDGQQPSDPQQDDQNGDIPDQQDAEDDMADQQDNNRAIRHALMDLRQRMINQAADEAAKKTVRERRRVLP